MSGASDLWGEFGKHHAQGQKGAQALGQEIERIARQGGITSPVTTTRGLRARLRYLDSPMRPPGPRRTRRLQPSAPRLGGRPYSQPGESGGC